MMVGTCDGMRRKFLVFVLVVEVVLFFDLEKTTLSPGAIRRTSD